MKTVIALLLASTLAWASAASPEQMHSHPAPEKLLPPGAEAFKRDIPTADVRFFDTGHFALETHAAEIARAIEEVFAR